MSSTPTAPDPEVLPSGDPTTQQPPGSDGGNKPSLLGGRDSRELMRAILTADHNSVLIALVLVVAVCGIAHPSFLSLFQIQIILGQSVYVGVIACGMAFLIAMRELDLSVASVLALTGGIAALLMNQGWNPWLAVFAALAIAGVIGATNGFLAVAIRIPALLATLATAYLWNGFNDGITSSNTVTPGLTSNEESIAGNHAASSSFFSLFSGHFLSLPVAFWFMVAFMALLTVILRYTPFGYRVRSIGSNPEAAAFSGIPLKRVRYQAFILTALAAGLAGVISLGVLKDADPSVGGADNLLAIAAVIIGGTAFRGGTASIFGAMVGAILLSAVTSGLIYFNISENWTQFALGAVILVAVTVDSVIRLGRRDPVVS
jgi:ribose transport system permease protein